MIHQSEVLEMEVARLRTKVLVWRVITVSFFTLIIGLLIAISFLWQDAVLKNESVRALSSACLNHKEADLVFRLSEKLVDYNDVCIDSYSRNLNILEETMPSAFTAGAGIVHMTTQTVDQSLQ